MFDTKVLTLLRGWTSEVTNKLDSKVNGVYVFGSFVNAEGRAFSSDSSDIDLLVETKEADPSQRVILLNELLPYCEHLDNMLCTTLGRKAMEPITSVTLTTSFEIEQGIHKDRNSRIFFASKSFLPLHFITMDVIQIGNALESDLLTYYFQAWTIIANTQAQRNKFLRKGTKGKRLLQDFDSSTRVLPKDLLRNAYAVYCLEQTKDTAFSNEDHIAKGLFYLRGRLEEKRSSHSEASQLANLLESNRPGGNGKILPVPVDLLMYAWELLSCSAQSKLMSLRIENKLMQKSRYASSEVRSELIQFQATYLHAVDKAIELYHGDDLVPTSMLLVHVTRSYISQLHEITSEDKNLKEHQLAQLASEWPQDVRKHLEKRMMEKGSVESQCKVGFEKLNYSVRGIEKHPVFSIRPLTYWIIQQFNKNIAMHKSVENRRMRAEYAERLLCTPEDYYCECPSALYLELAVITVDEFVPVIYKSTDQSLMGRLNGCPILTCGPEAGFVWTKHVIKIRENYHLNVLRCIQDALQDEFNITPEEIVSWRVNSLALQNVHLNTALLGVVSISLPKSKLDLRLKKTKYHADVECFLDKTQLFSRVESDFGKGIWHSTGLLRLTLAAEYMNAVE